MLLKRITEIYHMTSVANTLLCNSSHNYKKIILHLSHLLNFLQKPKKTIIVFRIDDSE